MTEQEYLTQKADLDQQQADLESAWLEASVVPYPCWMYHETQGSVVVNSEGEAAALGPGWTTMPAGTPVEASPKTSAPKDLRAEKKRNADADRLT